MQEQNLQLSEDDLSELENAVTRLEQKGTRESLVLLEDHAFLVGVPNRQVVALMTRREAADTIFSQVGSAITIR